MAGQERVGEGKGKDTTDICMGNALGEEGKQEKKSDGGMLMEIKRELLEKGEKIEVSREGIIVEKIKKGRSWKIVGVYVKDNMGEMLQELKR